jgi:hypothetical protein
MPDDIDALLKEEGDSTDSQTVKKPAVDEGGKTPEEIAWSELKGSTQDRVRRLIEERNQALNELENLKKASQFNVPPPPSYVNPQVQEAVNKLSDVGIATKDFVKEEVSNKMATIAYNYELDRLENKYNGSDDRPKFTRTEYEDFVSRNPQYKSYLPEDVYKIMYQEELLDYEIKHISSNKGSRAPSLKPTSTQKTGEGELTLEEIEDRLKQPDGRKWYEKNIDKINRVLAQNK